VIGPSLQELQDSIPSQGFFKGKEWLLSPEPFRLDHEVYERLLTLGEDLSTFLSACDDLYRSSKIGSAPSWISELLDQGKPSEVIEMGISPSSLGEYPRIIRPDILLTDEGIQITELDATPGGIGLTAWLNQLYERSNWPVIGGGNGMIDGFREILAGGRVIFSKEALDYRPEIEWIVSQLDPTWKDQERIVNEWEFDYNRHLAKNYYRYFEMWDLPNVSQIDCFKKMLEEGKSTFTAPMKAYIEEKLWLALLWTPGLYKEWINRIGEENLERLKCIIPQGWVLDPTPIPYNSVYPGLNIQNWDQLGKFSKRERQIVIKISGFSEKAWGSRGVTIGHDISSVEWKKTVAESLNAYSYNPRILQRFHQPKIVRQPYYDRKNSAVRIMEGRVRLSPYYFRTNNSISLGGVLATICPKEKKIIHGMKDAIMVPCIT
jgi:hypothetical protein